MNHTYNCLTAGALALAIGSGCAVDEANLGYLDARCAGADTRCERSLPESIDGPELRFLEDGREATLAPRWIQPIDCGGAMCRARDVVIQDDDSITVLAQIDMFAPSKRVEKGPFLLRYDSDGTPGPIDSGLLRSVDTSALVTSAMVRADEGLVYVATSTVTLEGRDANDYRAELEVHRVETDLTRELVVRDPDSAQVNSLFVDAEGRITLAGVLSHFDPLGDARPQVELSSYDPDGTLRFRQSQAVVGFVPDVGLLPGPNAAGDGAASEPAYYVPYRITEYGDAGYLAAFDVRGNALWHIATDLQTQALSVDPDGDLVVSGATRIHRDQLLDAELGPADDPYAYIGFMTRRLTGRDPVHNPSVDVARRREQEATLSVYALTLDQAGRPLVAVDSGDSQVPGYDIDRYDESTGRRDSLHLPEGFGQSCPPWEHTCVDEVPRAMHITADGDLLVLTDRQLGLFALPE